MARCGVPPCPADRDRPEGLALVETVRDAASQGIARPALIDGLASRAPDPRIRALARLYRCGRARDRAGALALSAGREGDLLREVDPTAHALA